MEEQHKRFTKKQLNAVSKGLIIAFVLLMLYGAYRSGQQVMIDNMKPMYDEMYSHCSCPITYTRQINSNDFNFTPINPNQYTELS